ncbi:MAG: flagellar protein FliT [Fervidobacterium sp.]|jgi:hypothetical protein
MENVNNANKDIIQIELEIDKAIEEEDYEKLNLLLDERGKILPTLTENQLREVYERDLKRQKILNEKREEFRRMGKNLEEGKKMIQSYIQPNDKGNVLNGQG